MIESSSLCHFKAWTKAAKADHSFKFVFLIVFIQNRITRCVFLRQNDNFHQIRGDPKRSPIQKICFSPFQHVI